jgi:GDP-4-dehydro-6-deoxy-D-mannose reductase
MPTTTLVTGAAGFAGSHLIDMLAAGGFPLVAWHRPGGAPPRQMAGVIWEPIDLLDQAAVRASIARLRPAVVYHCAGAAHVGRSWDNTERPFAINVRATHHLLDAMSRVRLEAQVLIPSSALVYQPSEHALSETDTLVPASPYGLSKLAQELLGRRPHGELKIGIARSFNHFGPRQDPMFVGSGFARRIADIERGRWAPEISVGNLDARRDLTDVRDTVRAYKLILERGVPGRPYNVCTGRAVEIRQLLEMLVARAKVRVTIKLDPARIRPNDVPILLGDPARLRDETGWRPEIALEQTVDDLLAYWRSTES